MYLNCHTCYSYNYGLLSPEKLVEQALRYGVQRLVLTDINNTACVPEFIDLCDKSGIRPIPGIEFRQGQRFRYLGIAQNRIGYSNLNQFLDRHTVDGEAIPVRAPRLDGCFFVYDQLPCTPAKLLEGEYLGVRPNEVYDKVKVLGATYRDRAVIWQPVTLSDPGQFHLHKLLQSIGQNTLLTRVNQDLLARSGDHFIPASRLRACYDPVKEIRYNTDKLLERCECWSKDDNPNLTSFTDSETEDFQLLSTLAQKGLIERYSRVHKGLRERLRRELDLIARLSLQGYFLLAWDVVRYARDKNYMHVGRGSGANSMVAYCLYITDVDPVELDLYFERFINLYRGTPPDFDIDFNWRDRDDVLRYVYDRHGYDKVAILGAYRRYKGKSLVREIGKALGIDKRDLDVIIRRPAETHLHHPLAEKIFHYGSQFQRFPCGLSMHPGGIVLAGRGLSQYTARQMLPKGFPVTQFDMHHAEAWGFHKLDLLSQRGLGHIQSTVELVKQRRGEDVDIRNMARVKSDLGARELLRRGDCLGCFYIESPAMRGLLQKLGCDDYVGLVAASSIIRPGVARSGMMHEYIRRARGEATLTTSFFGKELPDTYGIMVYQEDVMRVVHHFAGFDLYEADMLRRLMTGKSKSHQHLKALKSRFFSKSAERGYSSEVISEVWRQVASFSGYAFCKAHSASYAAESFQSLYLKANYPLEFMVSVINNGGGFYDMETYLQEVRNLGAMIQLPCINRSNYGVSLLGNDLFLGFAHVKNLTRRTMERIASERQSGLFKSMTDFLSRVDIGASQLDILIRIGAFRCFGLTSMELQMQSSQRRRGQIHQTALFTDDTPYQGWVAEEDFGIENDPYLEQLELLGFPLDSAFNGDRVALPKNRILATEMSQYPKRIVTMVGYYVVRKPVTTVRGRHMCFAAWYDEAGDFFDTVHFPPVLEKYPLHYKSLYLLKGRICVDHDFPTLEVHSCSVIPGAYRTELK